MNKVNTMIKVLRSEKGINQERLLMMGVTLAAVVSYVNWHSIGWAILHGLLNWGYILYYIIRY